MDSDRISEEISGRYFDGVSTRPLRVSICLDESSLHASGELALSWDLSELTITERLGRSQRRILLAEGAYIEVADSPMWDALPQQWGRSGLHLAWLETRWRYVLASLVGIVVSCTALYIYALPWAVDRIAAQVPIAWVNALSSSTLNLIDRLYTEPTKLPLARQKEISAAFARWTPPEGAEAKYQLHFRDGGHLGPNAFAMPSGDIVVTDQLIALAKNDEEILGVLAHERGHLERRHALRLVMRSAAIAIAVNVLLGDMGDMTGSMAALLNLRYSRDFEREADDYALKMMEVNNVPPSRLAAMLEQLDPIGAKEESESRGYFATHPITAERIKRLRAQP